MDYTILQRDGRTVAEGNTIYSPDRKKLMYQKEGEMYLVNSDGTEMTKIGTTAGTQYAFITGSRIFASYKADSSKFVISKRGKVKSQVDNDWNLVGRTKSGEVLFTKGNTLFLETGNEVEKKLADIGFKCRYASAVSQAGPFIALSDTENDGIFLVGSGSAKNIGKASKLLVLSPQASDINELGNLIKFSPDGGSVVFPQEEGSVTTLRIVNMKNGDVRNAVIDYQKMSSGERLNFSWLSKDMLVVYCDKLLWLIDLKENISIYRWEERSNSYLKDAFIKP
jgi:hypothetical protein